MKRSLLRLSLGSQQALPHVRAPSVPSWIECADRRIVSIH